MGRRFKDPLAESINSILALAVKQSYQSGLIEKHLNTSGDGTCMETGASPYGRKTCGYKSRRIAFATLMAAINIHLDAQLKIQMSEYHARLANNTA